MGRAAGQSTSRQVGAAIGTALLGATLIAGLGTVAGELTDRGVPEPAAVAVRDSLQATAGTAITGLPAQPDGDVVFAGAAAGFTNAIKDVAYVAAGLIALGVVAALFLPVDAARTEAAGYVSESRPGRGREPAHEA